jgi:hypothetical protein
VLRSYRLKIKRALGNLFGVGSGGCTDFHSGIGNVSYVKDILTETVVTTKFNCSQFGPHTDFGWVTVILHSIKITLVKISALSIFQQDNQKFGLS